MNFVQLLKSLDDLLYEIISWVIFFPITLKRVLTRPLTMMDYSDEELRDRPQERFPDTLSPPLFLLLALLLSHGLELALGGGRNPIVENERGLASLIKDDSSLLVLRLLIFSLFPMMLANRLVRASQATVSRGRLKAPFYAQCFAAAPFALFVGLGTSISHQPWQWASAVGGVIVAGTFVGYLVVQIRWFDRHLDKPLWKCAVHALVAMLQAAILFVVVAVLFA